MRVCHEDDVYLAALALVILIIYVECAYLASYGDAVRQSNGRAGLVAAAIGTAVWIGLWARAWRGKALLPSPQSSSSSSSSSPPPCLP